MGIGGISIWQLLIILVIVLLLFGTKRLRGLGSDLGGAIKGFRKAIKDDKEETAPTDAGVTEAHREAHGEEVREKPREEAAESQGPKS